MLVNPENGININWEWPKGWEDVREALGLCRKVVHVQFYYLLNCLLCFLKRRPSPRKGSSSGINKVPSSGNGFTRKGATNPNPIREGQLSGTNIQTTCWPSNDRIKGIDYFGYQPVSGGDSVVCGLVNPLTNGIHNNHPSI